MRSLQWAIPSIHKYWRNVVSPIPKKSNKAHTPLYIFPYREVAVSSGKIGGHVFFVSPVQVQMFSICNRLFTT